MGRSSINLNNYDDNNETGGMKPLKEHKENNQSANGRVDQVCPEAGLTAGQRKLLHKQLDNCKETYAAILEAALIIKRDYPNTK